MTQTTPSPDDFDELCRRVSQGDADALGIVFEIVFGDLRRMARHNLRTQPEDHTLQATALVNEVYMRLRRGSNDISGRQHFFRLAAKVMRQVLVDHARAKAAGKRPPGSKRVPFEELLDAYVEAAVDIDGLDAALEKLAKMDPQLVEIVELRFFAGRSLVEIEELMGMSTRTLHRRWETARSMLQSWMEE